MSRIDIIRAANQTPAAMVTPMADFMAQRKALPSIRAACIYGDDGPIAVTDNPRLTPIKETVSNLCAQRPGNCLQVNFLRFCDTEFL
jgi:hypothetical protein